MRRWFTVVRYQAWCGVRSRAFWLRLVGVCLQVGPLVWAVQKAGLKTTLVAILPFAIGWFWRLWREGRSPNLKAFERNAAERAAILYRAVSDLQRREELHPEQVAAYQRDILRFIAQYVRDHRRDSATPTIFANLLCEDGDHLVVLARDRDHRQPGARYPKAGMLVAEAIATGEVQLTGNFQEDFPNAPSGKPYMSILVVPVFSRGKIVGAVSIDSSSLYHFDLDFKELVDHLAPYVNMLGWTISAKMTRSTRSGMVSSRSKKRKPKR